MIPTSAVSCPSCGADFSESGLEELEEIAKDIKGDGSSQTGGNELS